MHGPNHFTYAITRKPGPNLTEGLTKAELGPPDYEKALVQHQQYVQALQACGLDVTVLDADGDHPDAVFVEDPAVLTPRCAIITNPGTSSRKGETRVIRKAIARFYDRIAVKTIKDPGTLEGGDVLQAGNHFYIGLSERTNKAGAQQLIDILAAYGFMGSMVDVGSILHLKTGLSFLHPNCLVALPGFAASPHFTDGFDILKVDPEESYAANCLWINDTVLVPAGYPKAKAMIEDAGYTTIELNMSEYQKLDGGLSCLSLRF